MAHTTLRPNHSKPFHGLGLFVLLILMQRACATQFKVGGSNGWAVPTDPNAYNQWAERNRFQPGDSLLFVYPTDKDSVLQVNKDDYTNCKTESPIASFNDGSTSFMFKQSGPYYFISGNGDKCLKNEKIVVIVMSDRSNRSSVSNTTTNASPPSPPPSPSSDSSPPEINPSTPSPSASNPPPEINPSTPPPSASSPPPEINPSTPPPSASSPPPEITPPSSPDVEETPNPPPPPNGVSSSTVVSFMGSIGLLGLSLLLVL